MWNPFGKRCEFKPPKPPAKEENLPPQCSHSFGYLAIRPKDDPIAQECLLCPKLADCMVITLQTRYYDDE